MNFGETVLLGAIAGSTIYLGLPFARVGRLDRRGRVALAMFAVGILAFLFVDVLEHAFAIVEEPVEELADGAGGSWGEAIGLFALLAVGFSLGTGGLAAADRRVRASARPPVGGASQAYVAPAMEAPADTQALQTGLTIAAAIGLHNFAEGLAIGVSAAAGEVALATVLIIGFALHNATEGFGIIGPLGGTRPSWRWLGLAGLIGGGPVFVGTIVGYQVEADALELAFYGLAGGAIIYVIGEVWHGMRRFGHRELGLAMLAAGFLAGFATDLVVAYGGG
jgi:zinc transporter, ZIP family